MKVYLTERLEVRDYIDSDYDAWKEAVTSAEKPRNKYDGTLNAHLLKDISEDYFRKLLREIDVQKRKDRIHKYAAFTKDAGRLVGELDFFVICREHYQIGNMGYAVHNRQWGNGYAKEIAAAGLHIGFQELGFHRLEAAVNLDNPASEAVALGIGMIFESVKKSYIKSRDGWDDMKVYIALATGKGTDR